MLKTRRALIEALRHVRAGAAEVAATRIEWRFPLIVVSHGKRVWPA